ncbi:MAG: DUF5668 domain-containing protein [Acidobacteriia bacterium]|nr:DUF5668 domain-containing protein [Terriglobia bacterium]
MADRITSRCPCACCRVRGLMGPLILIALGAIFLADQFTRFTFGDLWPILLIVAGAVKCAASLSSRTGHAGV